MHYEHVDFSREVKSYTQGITWEDIESEIHKVWKEDKSKPIRVLEDNLAFAMRELEMENYMVSRLCATPVMDYGTIPHSAIHIVLAIVSDKDTEASFEIGGKLLSDDMRRVQLKANTPTFFVSKDGVGWPAVNPTYHETRVICKDKSAKFTALGVRVHKDLHHTLDKVIIKDVCVFHGGICKPINDNNTIDNMSILKSISPL